MSFPGSLGDMGYSSDSGWSASFREYPHRPARAKPPLRLPPPEPQFLALARQGRDPVPDADRLAPHHGQLHRPRHPDRGHGVRRIHLLARSPSPLRRRRSLALAARLRPVPARSRDLQRRPRPTGRSNVPRARPAHPPRHHHRGNLRPRIHRLLPDRLANPTRSGRLKKGRSRVLRSGDIKDQKDGRLHKKLNRHEKTIVAELPSPLFFNQQSSILPPHPLQQPIHLHILLDQRLDPVNLLLVPRQRLHRHRVNTARHRVAIQRRRNHRQTR